MREIDERMLKILFLTYFHRKKIGNVENRTNSPANIRYVAKTSDFGYFSHQIWGL